MFSEYFKSKKRLIEENETLKRDYLGCISKYNKAIKRMNFYKQENITLNKQIRALEETRRE